jgi:hypothetical protein
VCAPFAAAFATAKERKKCRRITRTVTVDRVRVQVS